MPLKLISKKSTAALAISTTVALFGISLSRLKLPFETFTHNVTSVPIIQPDRTIKDHSAWIYAIAITPDGKTLVNGNYDGTIKTWNLHTGKLLHTFKSHTDAVSSLAMSVDGRILVSGSWDNRIKLWNLETNTLISTLDGHKDDVQTDRKSVV